ncbi:unnamed protein product, partial [Ectocarpus fasciculatus]
LRGGGGAGRRRQALPAPPHSWSRTSGRRIKYPLSSSPHHPAAALPRRRRRRFHRERVGSTVHRRRCRCRRCLVPSIPSSASTPGSLGPHTVVTAAAAGPNLVLLFLFRCLVEITPQKRGPSAGGDGGGYPSAPAAASRPPPAPAG